MYLGGKLLFLK